MKNHSNRSDDTLLSNLHSEEHQSKQPLTHAKSKEEIQYDTDQLAETVDHAMKAYDENDDGYIYYGEFYRYLYFRFKPNLQI